MLCCLAPRCTVLHLTWQAFRYDDTGSPRVWSADIDVDAVAATALERSLRVLRTFESPAAVDPRTGARLLAVDASRGLERGVTSSCRQAIKMVKFARGLRGEYALSVRGWRKISVWALLLAPMLSYALPALVARLVACGAADGAHTRVVLMV